MGVISEEIGLKNTAGESRKIHEKGAGIEVEIEVENYTKVNAYKQSPFRLDLAVSSSRVARDWQVLARVE